MYLRHCAVVQNARICGTSAARFPRGFNWDNLLPGQHARPVLEAAGTRSPGLRQATPATTFVGEFKQTDSGAKNDRFEICPFEICPIDLSNASFALVPGLLRFAPKTLEGYPLSTLEIRYRLNRRCQRQPSGQALLGNPVGTPQLNPTAAVKR